MIFYKIIVIFKKLKDKLDKLLIAAVTPFFLEKGADWFISPQGGFSQNLKNILENKDSNPFLERNILIIEKNQKISLSEFLRRIAELGYTKVGETTYRGEFSQRGGVIQIFPINSENIFAVEFEGNFISDVIAVPRSSTIGVKSPKTPSVSPQGAIFHFGDYVVHIDHGVGIFKGEESGDLIIEYAAPKNHPESPDLLFVPKTELKRIQPYLGFKKPEIYRLGTPLWLNTKKKAREDILKYARELLENFAKRKIATRAPYIPQKELEDELAASFPFEYTPDQQKSLLEIFKDMSQSESMDRLLTGDVGFGKTEIALRAAYRAILNNRQAAIVAPTTILADQHFELFKKRLEPLGVIVARLSRLESGEEIKNTIKKISEGKIDLAIGTHKLFGKHIDFKKLGLLIIDEEQKFGVLQKEHFKKIYPALDVLTLSATPIPRTLQLALSKIRSLSSLGSAPEGRIEIKTYVLPKNKKIIKEAINFELARDGQIYFLANRIHKMPALIDELKKLKTKAKIGILHGKMPEEKIIKIMREFREAKINLLVSTTIIENGLDISSVNTLIAEDATRLGLAQAHQLRGRIGRGSQEAFAYFFYPASYRHAEQKIPSPNPLLYKGRGKGGGMSYSKLSSRKFWDRLEALERYSWLGAGMEIAKRDLELRGAGNILGRAQSGIAFRIGLNLYFQLLEEAVEELKNSEV